MSLKHTPLLAFLLLICHRLYIYLSRYIHIYPYILIYIYMVPCPVFPPPPWDGGGYDAPVVVYIHTYIPTYLPTYLHTYVHTYIPLHYLTLHYLTLHSIHTYIHTNIPTYHHHRPRGGTRRTRRYCPPIPIGGGEGGWPTLHHIYIYLSIYIFT